MIWTRADTSVIPNFRDVGGHPTLDGRNVRTGRLYRSVDLFGLNEAATDWLIGVGIRTVIDLRTAPERERRPDRPPPDARTLVLDVLADSGQADPAAFYELMRDPPRASRELAGGASERFFVSTYLDFVRLPSARSAFGELYRRLAEEETHPALVHCTTGKDRTGWAVAVLLLWLGVDEETVMADYLRSDTEIREAFGSVVDDFVARGGDRDVIDPIVSARSAYLAGRPRRGPRSCTDRWRPTWPIGLGLTDGDLERLRAVFLEPA